MNRFILGNGLIKIGGLDVEFRPGHPNSIGWKALDKYGLVLGEVTEIIANQQTGHILIIAVGKPEGKQRLYPSGAAWIDRDYKEVVLSDEAETLWSSPEFTETTKDVEAHFDYWLGIAARRSDERSSSTEMS